jgi:hypothetical protein
VSLGLVKTRSQCPGPPTHQLVSPAFTMGLLRISIASWAAQMARGFFDLPQGGVQLLGEEVNGPWTVCAPPSVEAMRLTPSGRREVSP